MRDRVSPTRKVALRHLPASNRCWGKGAATPFIVHGHRLSSLYRDITAPQIPFIVLKILKKLQKSIAQRFEYLQNNETLMGQQHA